MNKQKITTIVVILVILIGIWWYFMAAPKKALSPSGDQNQQTQNTTDNSVPPSAPTDTSDSGIDQDVKSVDSELQGLGTDSANANQDVSVPTVTQ